MSVSLNRLQGRSIRAGRKGEQARTYLDLFEQAYDRAMVDTGQYVRAMRFEGSNEGRGQVDRAGVESVNATEVRATARLRVRRNDPSSESYLEVSRDVDRNYRVASDKVSQCRSIVVPLWLLEVTGPGRAVAVAESLGRTWRDVSEPDKARKARKVTKSVSRSQARRDRMRVAVAAVAVDRSVDYLSDAS